MPAPEGTVGVAVFSKAPRPRHAKTRLIPALGAEGAARLAAAFLEDVVSRVRNTVGLEPEIWAASEQDREALEPHGLPVHTQPEGHLGRRMGVALKSMLSRHRSALIVGSDLPTLPASRLIDARAALAGEADVVLGPSADGGFYLVGVRERPLDFGDGVRWSTEHALDDTISRARSRGRAITRLRPWYDVDAPEDLDLLRTHLALRPKAAAATAAVLVHFDRLTRA